MMNKPFHTLRMTAVSVMLALVSLFASVGPASAALPSDVVTRPGEHSSVMLNYPERFEKPIRELDKQATKSMKTLRHRLGVDAMPTVDVWLVSDLDDYFEWKEVPSRAPTWAIGLSLVDRHTVLVRHGLGPNRQLVNIHETFEHELAHVAIDVARQGHHVPRWFNEGFASYHADEWTLERGEEVVHAAATSSLIPLKDLDRTFPDHAQVTSLAYAQSHHFTRFLAEQYGDDVFGKLIARIRDHQESFPLHLPWSRAMISRSWS